MNKLKYLIAVFLFTFLFKATAIAQTESFKPLTISLFTVGTQLPGGKVLPIHPGMELGTEFKYNKSETTKLFQTLKLGVYHHRYSQTAIQFYSEFGYRPTIWNKLSGDAKLGIGYLHAFPNLQQFKLDNGIYTKSKAFGRSQFMASVSVGFGYDLSDRPQSIRIFLVMQTFFQTPFIKSYVPVLPNSALHIGISVPFFKTIKK